MTTPAGTKARLIDAAMQLFWEKGYGSTSIQDVLLKVGVHAGSLYHFFPAKQDLLLAVLERYREGLYPMLLNPAWEKVEDPIERIFALLGAYRKALLSTDCFYGCPIGSLALELHEPDPAVRELLADNFTGWTAAVESCLTDAGARIPGNVNRAGLASFVLTVMEGGVMQARTHRRIDPFDAAVASLRDYFTRMGALASRQRPKPRRRPTTPPTKRKR